MVSKIPIPYQVILKRLHDRSFKDIIEVRKAKTVLCFICRIPKNLLTPAFNEMVNQGWIKYENYRTIKILKKVNCDLLYRHTKRHNFNPGSES